MGSNEVLINGSVAFEVPDSWMEPLWQYLKLVKTKTAEMEELLQEGEK